MAGPCGVVEEQWPFPCDLDTYNGMRYDPVAKQMWVAPEIIQDGIDVVFGAEFPFGGAVGPLQISPTRTVRYDNPSSCLPFVAYITHGFGYEIVTDQASQVNLTHFMSFAVNAPAPAPVLNDSATVAHPYQSLGNPVSSYQWHVLPGWFSPVVIPPGGYVETAHFSVVSAIRTFPALPTWGAGCQSVIKISGGTTQA